MDYVKFFIEDNKNGCKTRPSYLKENHPIIFNEISNFVNINSNIHEMSFKQKIWHFMYNIPNSPTCLHCKSPVKFKGTLNKGYSKFCSIKCFNNYQKTIDGVKYVKLITNEKYSVDSTNQLDSVKIKKRLSYQKKYGVDNPMQNEHIKLKQQDSLNKSHGVRNPMHSDVIKNTLKTIINEKYGVDNVFQNELIKEKIVKTNQKNLGVDYPSQSKEIKNKIKNVNDLRLKEKYPFLIKISKYQVIGKCSRCDDEFTISRILLNERNREGYKICPNCNPIGLKSVSSKEKDICDFISSLNIDIIENDKDVLNGKELDIYIPSHNLAIEFNGLYWHSELFIDKNYHLNKTEECEKKGVQLIHIF